MFLCEYLKNFNSGIFTAAFLQNISGKLPLPASQQKTFVIFADQ